MLSAGVRHRGCEQTLNIILHVGCTAQNLLTSSHWSSKHVRPHLELCVQRSPLDLLLSLLLWLFYLPLSRFISRDMKAEQHPSEPQTVICLCWYTALGETSSIPLSLWCVPAVRRFCRTPLTVSYSLISARTAKYSIRWLYETSQQFITYMCLEVIRNYSIWWPRLAYIFYIIMRYECQY